MSPAQSLFDAGRRQYDSQRFKEAAESWGQAALLQHGPSHAFLSNMLIEVRQDVPRDSRRAFELASAGASMGCVHSKGALGRCYMGASFESVPEDHAKGYALGRESADAGSCMGQHVVALAFARGHGVEEDNAEAVRWWRLAAEQGHATSQYNLGNMFVDGVGVAQDYTEAVRCYRLAAEQGFAHAQAMLGTMFEYGKGVAQDKEEAKRLYHLAKDQPGGNLRAMSKLGLPKFGYVRKFAWE